MPVRKPGRLPQSASVVHATGAKILDGKATAEKIRSRIAEKVAFLSKTAGRPPGLVALLVGQDPASEIYVAKKHDACIKAGFFSKILRLPQTASQNQILREVYKLNKDPLVDGFIVQLPLPEGVDEQAVIEAILPEKDVDGFHPVNQGRLLIGLPGFLSATPKGILRLLKEYGIALEGKHVVVVGRSNIVGKPAAVLFLRENATVTVCHSRTKDLEKITRQADVLVAAVGKIGLITARHVRKDAVVVDVAMNRLDSGKLVGDVDFANVSRKASWITPVPGGIGPMTIAMLLENTLDAYQRNNHL